MVLISIATNNPRSGARTIYDDYLLFNEEKTHNNVTMLRNSGEVITKR